jgi:hypothetical protein
VQSTRVENRLVVRGAVLGAVDSSGSRIWVRVPVQGGEPAGVDPAKPARILVGQGAGSLRATVTTVPPPGVSNSRPALYLSLSAGAAAVLRQGQQVRVRLELAGAGARKTVPYSAVIYWLDGGTWVYEQSAPLTFVRSRIVVDYVKGDVAVLSSGPAAGTDVVKVGGVELLGTEFEIEGE